MIFAEPDFYSIMAVRSREIQTLHRNRDHGDAQQGSFLRQLEETKDKDGRCSYLTFPLTPVQQKECDECIDIYSRVSSRVDFRVRAMMSPSSDDLCRLELNVSPEYNGCLDDFRKRLSQWRTIQRHNTSSNGEEIGARRISHVVEVGQPQQLRVLEPANVNRNHQPSHAAQHTASLRPRSERLAPSSASSTEIGQRQARRPSRTTVPDQHWEKRMPAIVDDDQQPTHAPLRSALIRTPSGRLVPSSKTAQSLREANSDGLLVATRNMPETEARAFIQGYVHGTNMSVAKSVISLSRNQSALSLSSGTYASFEPIMETVSETTESSRRNPTDASQHRSHGRPSSEEQQVNHTSLPERSSDASRRSSHRRPSSKEQQVNRISLPESSNAASRRSSCGATRQTSQSQTVTSRQSGPRNSRAESSKGILQDKTNMTRDPRPNAIERDDYDRSFLFDTSETGASECGSDVSFKKKVRLATLQRLREQEEMYTDENDIAGVVRPGLPMR